MYIHVHVLFTGLNSAHVNSFNCGMTHSQHRMYWYSSFHIYVLCTCTWKHNPTCVILKEKLCPGTHRKFSRQETLQHIRIDINYMHAVPIKCTAYIHVHVHVSIIFPCHAVHWSRWDCPEHRVLWRCGCPLQEQQDTAREQTLPHTSKTISPVGVQWDGPVGVQWVSSRQPNGYPHFKSHCMYMYMYVCVHSCVCAHACT